jgi:hypothetical protein
MVSGSIFNSRNLAANRSARSSASSFCWRSDAAFWRSELASSSGDGHGRIENWELIGLL